MSPEEQAGVQLLKEAHERWQQMPPVRVTIGRQDAYIILMACQGMVSHPALPPNMARAMEAMGRQFQDLVCDTAEIYAMFEAGWNRDFDVEPDPAERQRESAGATAVRPCTRCGGTPSSHIGWAKGHLYKETE